MNNKDSKSKLRAVDYGRTSGPNYTSLESQNESNVKFIEDNEWQYIGHYEDENLSGAKIEGRDDFQRMMKDATKDKFDIIVVYDVTRFARDGCDIISNAKFLKNTFDINVIDTKGSFDSRDHRRTLSNYVQAGMAEDERLRIMERTKRGSIKCAEQGKPWSGKPPIGRAYDEEKGWHLTEKGEQLCKLLIRYANGESVKLLAKEFGIISPHTITRYVRESQLSGIYYAEFHCPEIGINHRKIPVPGMPEVISSELEKRVRERTALNKKWNKRHKRKYVLSGVVNCVHCGKSLKGQTSRGRIRYIHHNYYADDDKRTCPYNGIDGNLLESSAFDYLYNFFVDKPAYNKAVKAALPSGDDRKALEKDIKQVNRKIAKTKTEISYLVNAITKGADPSLLIDRQDELKAQLQTLENRRDELNQTLTAMPNPEVIKQDAKLLRYKLMSKHWGKDWRKIPYDDKREFLQFLFSDNPKKKGYGIFVGMQNGKWHITFEGCVEFYHDIVDGRPDFSSHFTQEEIDCLTAKIEAKRKSLYGVIEAGEKCEKVKNDIETLQKLIEEAEKYQKIVQESKKEVKKLKEYSRLKPGTDYIVWLYGFADGKSPISACSAWAHWPHQAGGTGQFQLTTIGQAFSTCLPPSGSSKGPGKGLAAFLFLPK